MTYQFNEADFPTTIARIKAVGLTVGKFNEVMFFIDKFTPGDKDRAKDVIFLMDTFERAQKELNITTAQVALIAFEMGQANAIVGIKRDLPDLINEDYVNNIGDK